jgi:outer membrane immunogenic protein
MSANYERRYFSYCPSIDETIFWRDILSAEFALVTIAERGRRITTMRRLVILLATILVAGIEESVAADLPAQDRSQVPIAYSAPFSWSGIYAGLNGGGAFGHYSDFGGSVKATGFAGGGQVGGQMQVGQIVLGVEADFQGVYQSHSDNFIVFGVPVTLSEKMPWFGTVRGRVGYAFDRVMVYGTGGVAWVDGKVEATAGGFSLSSEASNFGWTAGAGVEWAFYDRWSTKLEYLYLSSTDIKFNTALGSFNANIKDNIVRVGLNYRF